LPFFFYGKDSKVGIKNHRFFKGIIKDWGGALGLGGRV